jgi:hypothetical protein
LSTKFHKRAAAESTPRGKNAANREVFLMGWKLSLRASLGLSMVGAFLVVHASVPAHGQLGADRPLEDAAASNRVVVVRAGRSFDGKSDKLSNDQVIVIQANRITEVGPADRVQLPAGAEILDLSRSTVLPGLIYVHTHLFLTGESFRQKR